MTRWAAQLVVGGATWSAWNSSALMYLSITSILKCTVMKKHLLTISTCFIVAASQGQTVLVNENFDSYTAGSFLAQSAGAPWTTWSNSPGGSDDVPISTEQAASGTNSGVWVSTSVTGGPGDVVLNLGNQTTGVWSISFNMYIPSNFGGYFNVLHIFQGSSSQWAVEVNFPANGDVSLKLQGATTVYGSYPHDVWFPVLLTIDMDQSSAVLHVNNTQVFNWPFEWDAASTTDNLNQLAGIDFYAYAGGNDGAKFYIDDVLVHDLLAGVDNVHGPTVSIYPNPVVDMLHISNVSGQGSWLLRDAAGRTVREGMAPNGAADWTLNVGDLPAGVYQFDLLQNGRRTVRKVVKG
jgi:hypothetical protein